MTNIPAVVNPRAPKRMVGCELLNLAAHNPADLVQLSEQQYQSRIDAAAAYVLASGRRIVMLTGPSAAQPGIEPGRLFCGRGPLPQTAGWPG